NLPLAYQRTGVSIGDVGRMTPEGVFDFFFNIYRASDDLINAKTPDDFVPLPLINSSEDMLNYWATYRPFPGGEFGFSCMVPNSAVLTLPHGARPEKLENLDCVRRYAAKHADSWYSYVKSRHWMQKDELVGDGFVS
ncbi:hypothetical protein B0H16DRAFT_1337874, partial [Mycena metata]